MPDLAHEATEKEIDRLEKKLKKEYKEATKGIEQKLNDHWKAFERKNENKLKMLADGKIDQKEYERWRYGQIAVGGRWEDMRRTLAEDMVNADNIARKIVDGSKADVYALNGNFASYQIEHQASIDVGFSLYNHDAVERLLKDNPQILPPPGPKVNREVAEGKAILWNESQIQSAVTQGIMQGMSMPELANYIADNLGARNYNAAMRYARTSMTEAQNAGRYDAFRKAKKLGVDLMIEWEATLDNRTRHAHRQMHGQRREVDEPFETPDGYTIYYPADCSGSSDIPQNEIWNCRCTLLSWVKGYEGDTVKESPKMGDMSFEEWQSMKQPEINTNLRESKKKQNRH